MRSRLTWMLLLALVFAPALSSPAVAQETKRPQPLRLRNVELNKAGSLEGRLLNRDGKPLVDQVVTVRDQGDPSRVALRVRTDQTGRFVIPELKSGMVVIETSRDTYAVRVWAHGTAPPKSLRNIALIKSGAQTLRGQDGEEQLRLIEWIESLSPAEIAALGALGVALVAIPLRLNEGS